jgi:predicted DNA-binding transcriptional regulator AlpA
MSAHFPQRFVCTKEAAAFTGVSSRTLEKHRTCGTGPQFCKVGGRVLYAVDDLTGWITRGAKRSTSEPDTIPPAKPLDQVNRVGLVPDSTIVIDTETATARSMSTPEAARFLGLSVQTLSKHRTYGSGPRWSKIGRRVVYAIGDLTEWVERGAKGSTSEPDTISPAKPVDRVSRVGLVPDSTIVVDVETAEATKLDDQVGRIEPSPNSTTETGPSTARATVEIAEITKPSTQDAEPRRILFPICDRFSAKYPTPDPAIVPLAGSVSEVNPVEMPAAGHAGKPALYSRRRGAPRRHRQYGLPPAVSPAIRPWIAPIPPGWPDSESAASGSRRPARRPRPEASPQGRGRRRDASRLSAPARDLRWTVPRRGDLYVPPPPGLHSQAGCPRTGGPLTWQS